MFDRTHSVKFLQIELANKIRHNADELWKELNKDEMDPEILDECFKNLSGFRASIEDTIRAIERA